MTKPKSTENQQQFFTDAMHKEIFIFPDCSGKSYSSKTVVKELRISTIKNIKGISKRGRTHL